MTKTNLVLALLLAIAIAMVVSACGYTAGENAYVEQATRTLQAK